VPYSLRLHRDVERQLERISSTDRERVVDAMRSLRDSPRPQRCVHLEENLYRVRVGDYRIIYAIFDAELVVFVCKTARRTEATYREIHALLTRARQEVQGE